MLALASFSGAQSMNSGIAWNAPQIWSNDELNKAADELDKTTKEVTLNIIKKIVNAQNAKNLFIEYVDNGNYGSVLTRRSITDAFMHRIDQLDPNKNIVTFTTRKQNLLPFLIGQYGQYEHIVIDQNFSFKQDPSAIFVTRWVDWFLGRGIGVNQQDNYNMAPLGAAVSIGLVDTVQLLLTRGASLNSKISYEYGHGGKNLRTPSEIAKLVFDGTENDPQEQDLHKRMGEIQGILGRTTLGGRTLTRGKVLVLATAITLGAIYKWAIGSPKLKDDVLINNTAKSIFVARNGGQYQELKVGENLFKITPEDEIIAVKLTKDQATADLEVKLRLVQYSANRENNYLNLVISKSWVSWLWGRPLVASPHWTAKSQKAE